MWTCKIQAHLVLADLSCYHYRHALAQLADAVLHAINHWFETDRWLSECYGSRQSKFFELRNIYGNIL